MMFISPAFARTHVSRAVTFSFGHAARNCAMRISVVNLRVRFFSSGQWLMGTPLHSADKPPLFGVIARHWRDAGSRNAEGRLRFPSAAFRDVELNALNYRRSSTSRVAFGLTPRSLLKMEWALVGRGDR